MRKRRRARWGSGWDKTVEFLCFFLTNRPFPHIVSLRIIRVLTIKGGRGHEKAISSDDLSGLSIALKSSAAAHPGDRTEQRTAEDPAVCA